MLRVGISIWAVGLSDRTGPLSSPSCGLLLIRTQDSRSTLGFMVLSSAKWEYPRGQELVGQPGRWGELPILISKMLWDTPK